MNREEIEALLRGTTSAPPDLAHAALDYLDKWEGAEKRAETAEFKLSKEEENAEIVYENYRRVMSELSAAKRVANAERERLAKWLETNHGLVVAANLLRARPAPFPDEGEEK